MNKTTINIPALMQSAIALHQQGQFEQARQHYQQVLLSEPNQFDAMHLLGVIARQTGHPDDAVTMINHALDTLNGQFTRGHASAFCNLGAAYQDQRNPQRALECYLQAIDLRPDYTIAHNNLGNALKILGRWEEALQSFENALAYTPNYAEAYYNAGLVLLQTHKPDAALRCFERTIELEPTHADAYFARGNLYQKQQHHEQAIIDFDLALQRRPNHAPAYFNRGISFIRLRQYQDALDSFAAAIQHQPDYAQAYFYQANTLKQLGRIPEAITTYRKALQLGADAEQVNFALAALGVGATPSAPPVDYVKGLFDQYADHFDQHLVGVLNYDTPQKLAALFNRHRQQDKLHSIDLGCGTGLAAALLRPFSATLIGVDLSQKMLDQAARLNLYDQLVCADLFTFLRDQSDRFDLIYAADVLIYVGDLQQLFPAVATSLRSRAHFCFSVEEAGGDEAGYRLTQSRRYAHSESYLRALAAQAGLIVVDMVRESGRLEYTERTPTILVVLQKI